MRDYKYEWLLARMFIIESLGEDLYQALASKCKDPQLKAIYQALARNEAKTRDHIGKAFTAIGRPPPVLRAGPITCVARPILNAVPGKWLHLLLMRILKRRMYSRWHEKYHKRNATLWAQLLEHEEQQHELLGSQRRNSDRGML